MTDRTNHAEKLERIMEQVADSVVELSDEAIIVETAESGADPQQEAERTRLVLRQASETWQTVKPTLESRPYRQSK
jgi:hypothetical protein